MVFTINIIIDIIERLHASKPFYPLRAITRPPHDTITSAKSIRLTSCFMLRRKTSADFSVDAKQQVLLDRIKTSPEIHERSVAVLLCCCVVFGGGSLLSLCVLTQSREITGSTVID